MCGEAKGQNRRQAIIEVVGEDAEGDFKAVPTSSSQTEKRRADRRVGWVD